ncbi:protein-L-isoaspartate O-methyltransferase [Actinoplanes sp. SE50]|uniref:class I SAM-dependent methyltransferase n=1 Tax=unclassified Actinoplanes TaxID=2626549 RepID=UPI00023EDE76|nr:MULTISPECIES: class I SAM-dependent methyltransferase [unclassified Actinoplanes]AEV88180.1 Protein-L-isoaspartate O-methyltransferase [Actinoplanes sp. SE50/110]ATO86585.1 protein-L-isoaspartate O-methyltransferase [Actinoplanes sp. SE50]SLM04002.1 protein-L-isoaspartate O-methyltransferase [Actinoplanes sp. SE50/110]
MVRKLRRLAGRARALGPLTIGAVVITSLLVAAVTVAAVYDAARIAVCLLALLLAVAVAGVLRVNLRLAGMRADRREIRDLRVVLDQTQRRVVSAVERQRLNTEDRHRELFDAVARVQRIADRGVRDLRFAVPREVEATVQLFQGLTPRAPMPSSGDFALNPTDLLELLFLVRTRRPRLVLELGSGTSTVWLAYVLEQVGGRLISLDHDPDYAARTRAALRAHGLTGVAEVRDAPLTPVELGERSFPWYDPAALDDLTGVDLLLVDGPPAAVGPDSRYPALPVLEPRLADRATIVFDDANRSDEQAAIENWLAAVDGLAREGELLGRHAVLSYDRSTRLTTATATAPR